MLYWPRKPRTPWGAVTTAPLCTRMHCALPSEGHAYWAKQKQLKLCFWVAALPWLPKLQQPVVLPTCTRMSCITKKSLLGLQGCYPLHQKKSFVEYCVVFKNEGFLVCQSQKILSKQTWFTLSCVPKTQRTIKIDWRRYAELPFKHPLKNIFTTLVIHTDWTST